MVRGEEGRRDGGEGERAGCGKREKRAGGRRDDGVRRREVGGCGVDLSNEKVDPIGLRFDQSVRDTTGT